MASDSNKYYLSFLSTLVSDMVPEDHRKYLVQLKESGFNPKVIYDIGACVTTWTQAAKEVWPDAHFILFEAFEGIEFLYTGYDYHLGVLSDADDSTVKFYQHDMICTGNSYYREMFSDVYNDDSYVVKPTKRLDTVVSMRGFPLPDLVKIDVQGSEMDVIKGAQETLKHAKHLIVEMQHHQYNQGAPLVQDTKPFIESIGFECIAPMFCGGGYDSDYGFINTRL